MDYREYMRRIGLEAVGQNSFFRLHARREEPAFRQDFDRCLRAYPVSDEAFGEKAQTFADAQGVAVEEMILYLYIRMSERTQQKYRAMGIPEDVFFNTMFDITVSCRICHRQTGIYGINPVIYRWWLRLHLDCRLFWLGRLQFELSESLWDARLEQLHVKPGDPCLKVHIPEEEELTQAACEESFRLARAFFAKYFSMKPCVFFCRSWLIDPWLQDALPESSRIVGFQKLFHILGSENDPDAVVRWVFPTRLENPKDYPQDTMLRRAVRERLLKGLPMGLGLGIKI